MNRGLAALLAIVPMLVSGCAALSPRSVTTADRIAAFPTTGLPLEHPVAVRWNEYGVPWIEAQSDHDLAFTLGLVHAHLRLGQLAVAKRIVQGRLSESAGPFARDLDRVLRTIDFGYAAAKSEALMSPETHAWMQAFVDGLNWYQAHAKAKPPEYGLLALRDEPWTIQDLLAIARLAGTDITWLAAAGMLPARLQPGWQDLWQRALAAGADSPTSFGADAQHAMLQGILAGSSRSGSNAVAIAPERSATGGALLASDPHLGLFLPNFWILVGIRSPSYHAVGLMPPGLPILGLGRNDEIAWSGTNMHAAASELLDVSGLPPGSIESRQERIRTRLWPDSEVTIRRSPLGPIISDTPFFPARPGETIALRWVGHEPSDEIGAFLGAMRAHDAAEFRRAFASYAVGGENMICATRSGDICQVIAVHQPIRDPAPPADLVRRADDPAAAWHGEANALTLPWTLNPPGGLLASANNRATQTDFPLGYFYPTGERLDRLYQLLRAKDRLGPDDLGALQQDTLSLASLGLKTALVAAMDEGGIAAEPAFLDRLRSWDGRYDADAAGPVAFELLLYEVAHRLYDGPDGSVPRPMADWDFLVHYLSQDLAARPEAERKALLSAAVQAAAAASARFKTWGDMHRMRVGYILAGTPVIGAAFVLDEYGVGGSRNTVMKTAHGLVNGRHDAGYGSEARQICDLSDPDANRFVLFGGEDGWLGSANFADQVALWRAGRTIAMPLTEAAVRAQFPVTTVLTGGQSPLAD